MKLKPRFKVLCFLQNMWVRDPERVKASIAKFGEGYRIRFMRHALFAGCKTGRMIRTTFGDARIEQMVFEETTREIAGDARTVFAPDDEHIEKSIVTHEPSLIITFGKIASVAVRKAKPGVALLEAPHPAARQPDTRSRLEACAKLMDGFAGLNLSTHSGRAWGGAGLPVLRTLPLI